MRSIVSLIALCLSIVSAPVEAAMTADNLTKIKFSGGGRVMNAFAGKAAKDGLESMTSIDGDRQVTKTGKEVEVVDLAAEKIWTYKLKRSGKAGRCKVTTFAEQREAMAGLKELNFGQAQADAEADAAADGATLPEYEVNVTIDETDTQETHAGMTGNIVNITVLVHRPEMTLEQGGGARVATTLVVGPKPDGWDETIDWSRRYLEAMDLDGEQLRGLGQLLAASPQLGQAMDEYNAKKDALDGAILRSEMQLFTMSDPRAPQQEEATDEGIPTSLGGLGARLGGKLLQRKRDEANAAGPQKVFETSTVLQSYAPEASPLLVLPDRCEQ
ncbi:MAG: hypothetical protein AAGH76_12765 [Pseudomonadota bacterium]